MNHKIIGLSFFCLLCAYNSSYARENICPYGAEPEASAPNAENCTGGGSGGSSGGSGSGSSSGGEETTGPIYIGVVPELGVNCPGETLIIRMDDEDNDNESRKYWWTGDIYEPANTSIRVCKVPAQTFGPLWNSYQNPSHYYAVLKLSSTCPAGSTSFSRHFDNEDDNNRNHYSGNITPSVSNRNTLLYFCMFDANTGEYGYMQNFPTIASGFEYGVFAANNFPLSIGGINNGTGWVYTDNEDHDNQDHHSLSAAQHIISGGNNANLHLTKVIGSKAKALYVNSRVGDGHWIKTNAHLGNDLLRMHTVVENINNVLGFTAGVIVVLVDENRNPIYFSALKSWGINAAFFSSSTQRKDWWSENIPPEVMARAKGIAVYHKDLNTNRAIGNLFEAFARAIQVLSTIEISGIAEALHSAIMIAGSEYLYNQGSEELEKLDFEVRKVVGHARNHAVMW